MSNWSPNNRAQSPSKPSPNKMNKIFCSSSKSIRSHIQKALNTRQLIRKETKMLVTAQSWAIYKLKKCQLVRGFKVKQPLEVGNLSKIALFYSTLLVVHRYVINPSQFLINCIGITPEDKSSLINQQLISLQDLLYYMMLTNGSQSSYILAANMGLFVKEKRKGNQYDIIQLRQEKIDWVKEARSFIDITNAVLQQLALNDSWIGSTRNLDMNKSSVKDLTELTCECLKNQLFQEIIKSRDRDIKVRFRDEKYKWQERSFEVENTNQLLKDPRFQGVKTSYNAKFGGSLMTLYRSGSNLLLLIVMGSSGKDAKYSDTQKILDWYLNSDINT